MRERPRTTREWLALITQCRSSGLTDKEWCEQYGVNMSTFYNAINRLRKKACEIPDRETLQPVIDFTAKQDVVAINVVPDIHNCGQALSAPGREQMALSDKSKTGNTYAMELVSGSRILRIGNEVNPTLLETVLRMMGEGSC